MSICWIHVSRSLWVPFIQAPLMTNYSHRIFLEWPNFQIMGQICLFQTVMDPKINYHSFSPNVWLTLFYKNFKLIPDYYFLSNFGILLHFMEEKEQYLRNCVEFLSWGSCWVKIASMSCILCQKFASTVKTSLNCF
jgi:hypothetical protein